MRLRFTLAATIVAAISALVGTTPAGAALITANGNARTLADAMASQDGLVTGASFTTGPSAAVATGVATRSVGEFFPTDSSSFAVLTTGDVGVADPPNNSTSAGKSNGTSFRGVNDVTILKVDVNVPANANCIGFDAAYYSEEFPEFVGSQFNDAFLAEIDRNDWSYTTTNNAVTAPGNFAFDTNGKQLTVNTALASNTDTGLQYDGSTVLLRARTPVTTGAHSLYFTIFDAGDHIYDSAVFLDNLRAANVPAGQCVAGASPADTDGDGLRDDWERDGLDTDNNGTVDVDLPAMGADPRHKDLFVELDYMAGHQLSNAAINTVVTSFANAPVTNPDGANGIRLHVDNGSGSIMNPVSGATWGARSQSNSITHSNVLGSYSGSNYSWAAFDTLKSANFSGLRAPVFRYAISVHQYGCGDARQICRSSGIARGFQSSDFIVALGRTNAGVDTTLGNNAQSGTFMHEMGHTLGLYHGGNEGVNYKPNYLSIMNYLWQFSGLRRTDVAGAQFDYSRFSTTTAAGTVAALNEASLNETAGLVATGAAANYRVLRSCGATVQPISNINTAIDWNCDGTTGGVVAASINQDAAQTTLTPFDDWAAIRYRGGAVGGTGLSTNLPGETEVIDDVPAEKLQEFAQVAIGDSKKPTVEIKTVKRGKRPKVKVTARDDMGVEQLIIQVGGKQLIVPADAKGTGKTAKVLAVKIALKSRKRKFRVVAIDAAGNASGVVKYG